MSGKIIITPKERLILQKKLVYLEEVSKKNIENIQIFSDVDSIENFALTSLYEEQAKIIKEIDNLKNILDRVEIKQKTSQKFVELGSIVSYTLLPNKEEKITVEITSGSALVEITSGSAFSPQIISLNSPVGKALLGKKVGDVLKIDQSRKNEKLIQILEIK
jgi:transcription elongation factor GreA